MEFKELYSVWNEDVRKTGQVNLKPCVLPDQTIGEREKSRSFGKSKPQHWDSEVQKSR